MFNLPFLKYSSGWLCVMAAVMTLAACGGGGGGSGNRGATDVSQGGGLKNSALLFKEPDTFVNGRVYKTTHGTVDLKGDVASQFIPALDCDGSGPKSASDIVTIEWRNLANGRGGSTSAGAGCYHTGTIFGTGVRSGWQIEAIALEMGPNVIHLRTFQDGRHVGDDEIAIRRTDGNLPRVTYRYPGEDVANVPLGRPVMVRFSEPMLAADLHPDKLVVADVQGNLISGSHYYDANQHTWIFRPLAVLSGDSEFTVTLSADIRDEAGDGPLAEELIWRFRTARDEDVAPPQIVGQWPGPSGCHCVAPDTIIMLGFDEPLDPVSVSEASFFLEDQAGTRVPAAVIYHGANLQLVPENELAGSTRYSVTATTALTDTLGRDLTSTVVWSFVTADGSEQGAWQDLAESPEPLEAAQGVWTGTEYFVWGVASVPDEDACGADAVNCIPPLVELGKGLLYDPVTDQWRAAAFEMERYSSQGSTVNVPFPAPRRRGSMAWTGEEVVLFGGEDALSTLANGGRYHPVADSWSTMDSYWWDSARGSYPGIVGLAGHSMVWTGQEIILWGGVRGVEETVINRGWRYDPVNDELRITGPLPSVDDEYQLVPDPAAPQARQGHAAVWTGTEMMVIGGRDGQDRSLVDGGRYNPATDTWSPLFMENPVGAAGDMYRSVWTGSEMIVWNPAAAHALPGELPATSVRMYDPQQDTWRATGAGWEPRFIVDGQKPVFAVWMGEFMLVVGVTKTTYQYWTLQSGDSTTYTLSAYLYDPGEDVWRKGADTEVAAAGSATASWLDDQLALYLGRRMVGYAPL